MDEIANNSLETNTMGKEWTIGVKGQNLQKRECKMARNESGLKIRWKGFYQPEQWGAEAAFSQMNQEENQLL